MSSFIVLMSTLSNYVRVLSYYNILRWYLNCMFYNELSGNSEVLGTGGTREISFSALQTQYDYYQGTGLSMLYMVLIALSFKIAHFFALKYINSSSR